MAEGMACCDCIRTNQNPLKGLKFLPKSNLGYDWRIALPNGSTEGVIAYSDELIFTETAVYKRQ